MADNFLRNYYNASLDFNIISQRHGRETTLYFPEYQLYINADIFTIHRLVKELTEDGDELPVMEQIILDTNYLIQVVKTPSAVFASEYARRQYSGSTAIGSYLIRPDCERYPSTDYSYNRYMCYFRDQVAGQLNNQNNRVRSAIVPIVVPTNGCRLPFKPTSSDIKDIARALPQTPHLAYASRDEIIESYMRDFPPVVGESTTEYQKQFKVVHHQMHNISVSSRILKKMYGIEKSDGKFIRTLVYVPIYPKLDAPPASLNDI